LAGVLGAEQPCGLAYNGDAVTNALTDSRDELFVEQVQLQASGHQRWAQEMSPEILKAHCVEVRRIAQKQGFLK
jgi:hypothetical protein